MRTVLFSILTYFWVADASAQNSKTFVDQRDQQEYSYVLIDSLNWMTVNLNYRTDSSLSYKNKEKNATIYGQLYPYWEALNSCPADWRLPIEEDWNGLVSHMSGENPMPLISTDLWKEEGGQDRAESGLNLLPSGRWDDGKFIQLGEQASIWFGDEINELGALHWHVEYSKSLKSHTLHRHPVKVIKTQRFSVRCVQDAN